MIDGAYLETTKSTLELAINAKSLWNTRPPHERREFLDRLLSNPTLEGVTVKYELRKPWGVLAEMKQTEEWRPLVAQFTAACLAHAA